MIAKPPEPVIQEAFVVSIVRHVWGAKIVVIPEVFTIVANVADHTLLDLSVVPWRDSPNPHTSA